MRNRQALTSGASLSVMGTHGSQHDPNGISGRQGEPGSPDGCQCCCHFCCQHLLRRQVRSTSASRTLPARCTIKPLDAGSRQCPLVTTLLTEQGSSRIPSGSWPKPTPTGQHAWQDTNRSSGACLNACARTVRNRAATRTVLTALWTILASDLAQRSGRLEPQQR